MRIIQIVPTLSYGDAVGNDAMTMKKVIRNMGFETEIYAVNIAKPLDETEAKRIRRMPKLRKKDIAVLHLSTGAKINEQFADVPCRKIIRYHNITPPAFFRGNDLFLEMVNTQALKNAVFLADKADYCLAASQFNMQDLIRMQYQCKIDVLPVLIPFHDYQRQPDKEIILQYQNQCVILFTGRIAPNKKAEDVIKAFYMYKKYFNAHAVLILAGTYQDSDLYYKKLKSYVERLDLSDVVFTGHVRFEELLAYYHTADVFLCQSEHEGFCVPLVEAMCFDVPVVAYNSTAIPETMGGSGILMDTKEPLLTAGVIDRLIRDSRLRERVIQGQRIRLRSFGFETVKNQFERFLRAFIETIE